MTIIFVLLLLNFATAMTVVLRRRESRSWLLVLLLSSTTGAALAAVLALLLSPDMLRGVEVSAIFAGLATLSAVVAVVAHRQRAVSQRGNGGQES